MEDSTYIIKLIALLILAVQGMSSWIVNALDKKNKIIVTGFIVGVYKWLFLSTLAIFTLVFSQKVSSIPFKIDFLDQTIVVYIISYSTILLIFFPVKLIKDAITFRFENMKIT